MIKLKSENEQRLVDATRTGSALPGPGPGRLEWPTGVSFANFFKKSRSVFLGRRSTTALSFFCP